ncbi:MAG: hypothetical protein KKA79_08115 [Nanoarchaeota archaeon]|nr:hypothetical protein [Nanoarchaeota archaeon]MCG2717902.1 hypothetical protein [Nanoarchaeota archaeon]
MKFPKTFRPGKDLDGKIEDLLSLESLVYNPEVINALLAVGEEFLENKYDDYENFYDIGVGLVRGLRYGLKDVEEMSKRIKYGQSRFLGVYLSVLVNKVITEKDIVTLTLEEKLNCIGMYLQKGTLIIKGNTIDYTGRGMKGGMLIVEGNANNTTGCYMEGGNLIVKGNANDATGGSMVGGKLIVEGNANDDTGYYMSGGELVVEGNAKDYTGHGMVGGELVVEGKIKSISGYFKKGIIVEGGKVRRDY